jgi:hypothetical protein
MKRLVSSLFFTAALWGGFTCSLSQAGETHVVADMTNSDDYKVHQYNNASMEVEPADEIPTIEGGEGPKKSLKVKVNWPGGDEFHFAVLEIKNGLVPFECDSLGIWVKGSGTRHAIEIAFKGADGTGGKVVVGSGSSTEWTFLAKPLPSEVQQPITVQSVNIQDWDDKNAGETICYYSRLEAGIDSNKPLSK